MLFDDVKTKEAIRITMKKVKLYLKTMRVKHYIKNGLIFAALACSGRLFELELFFSGMTGFVAFSLISSVVYIINDIRDREKDAQHPSKRNRPIASGAVSIAEAWVLVVALMVLALWCNAAIFHVRSSLLLLLYLTINLAYSLGLKNIPLVDVTILTAGFLIRILYGAVITRISVSDWLWLTVVAISFYFSFGKRRNELLRMGKEKTRAVLAFYTPSFLDRGMYMCLGLANAFYALWCMDARTMQSYGGISLVLTVPIVLLITLRYSMDVEGDSDGDPVEVLFHDKGLLLLCTAYLVTMFVILYFIGGNGG